MGMQSKQLATFPAPESMRNVKEKVYITMDNKVDDSFFMAHANL
jgi:hypothetical protein